MPAAKPGLFIVLRIHEIEETALRVTLKAVELLSFCDDCLQRRRVCDQRGVQSGLVFSLLSGTSRERERARERGVALPAPRPSSKRPWTSSPSGPATSGVSVGHGDAVAGQVERTCWKIPGSCRARERDDGPAE